MRILFVNNVPAVRELGAGRVQLELAEELRRLGHEVDFFTPAEAGNPRRVSFGAVAVPSFAFHAKRRVRAVAKAYDVIEAQQGLITAPKQRLGIGGALIVRSSGLVDLYREADRQLVKRLPVEARGRRLGRVLREVEWQRSAVYARRSFEVADMIHVPNQDERRVLERRGFGENCVVVPNALTQQTLDRLAEVARGSRPETATVLFIASWTHRKGVADWPEILRATWAINPDVRFHFAGTGVSDSRVRRDLGIASDPRIEVTPAFVADELPTLLGQATVGALPSYIEGFGLSVLETLAAGRPCIAYDVPGPRGLIGPVNGDWLVRIGATEVFGQRLARAIEDERSGSSYAERCVEFSSAFSWSGVAQSTLRVYEQGLERTALRRRPNGRG